MKILLILVANFFGLNSFAGDCSNVKLASVLDRLIGQRKLHNCEIELVTREASHGVKKYMFLVVDETPLHVGAREPVLFEFETKDSCARENASEDEIIGATIHYAYGFTSSEIDYKAAMDVQMGFGKFPTKLMVQYINLFTHEVEQRASCRLDPEAT